MLAIRLQRTGRSGHAQFRVIVQDSRFSPKRGRIVAYLGSYNPHTKAAAIDSQTASKYLLNGARPSDRVARLLQKEGVKLPAWVKLDEPRQRDVRNPEKRRSTRPAEAAEPAVKETSEETAAETAVNSEKPTAAEDSKAEEKATAAPAAGQSTETPSEETASEPSAE